MHFSMRSILLKLRSRNQVFFLIFCIVGLSSVSWLLYAINYNPTTGSPRVIIDGPKPSAASNNNAEQAPMDNREIEVDNPQNLVAENRALVFPISPEKRSKPSIVVAFLHSRFIYQSYYYDENGELPPLVKADSVGVYSVIVFESYSIYESMTDSDRMTIDTYCREYGTGVIFYLQSQPEQYLFNSKIMDLPLTYSTGMTLSTLHIEKSALVDITKPLVSHDISIYRDWTIFHVNHSTYEVVTTGNLKKANSHPFVTAVLDKGLYDGVRRVFFGHTHQVWIHKILFLDALSYLTQNAMRIDKTKFIQVDIDDVFLGEEGTKMKPADVQELYKAQKIWSESYVKGFNFYLGFSGKFYQRGSQMEAEGDQEFLRMADKFKWFDHTFSHVQAHKYNSLSALEEEMIKNKEFSQANNLTVDRTYAVAPHHSGVYPVHEYLYTAWKNVWGINVTSTEEYLHLKPPWNIRGFIYREIHVLPRQVCGLYTKTYMYNEYPRGPTALEQNILGGDLFDTVLYNYVNIYMTHQQNYGNDRLAIYTFDKLFQLFHNSTDLDLRGAPPVQVAEYYFKKYPKEITPVWINPCKDKRHAEIWNESKSCDSLPDLLIVGPQKTGTTALYKFLKLHPRVASNLNSPETYEELQFFSNKNIYQRGLDWYMSFFNSSKAVKILFEKSATYFDDPDAPRLASLLVPDVKIIVILLDPVERAQSWYYHQQAHKDPVALRNSMYEVVSSNDTSVKSLKSRMLKPGFYYDHILNWLKFFSPDQIYYIDGEELRTNPAQVMSAVQQFLGLSDPLDYGAILTYNKDKGFFCIKTQNGKSDCLGRSKGRRKSYGEIDSTTDQYLRNVFNESNNYLKSYLSSINRAIPTWLQRTSSGA